MPALIATSLLACEPMPFLLRDQFDAVGDIIVIQDADWDDVLALMRSKTLPGKDVIIVETEQGPFMFIPDDAMEPGVWSDGNSGN